MFNVDNVLNARLSTMLGGVTPEQLQYSMLQQMLASSQRETKASLDRHIEDTKCSTCQGKSKYSELCMSGKLAISTDAAALGKTPQQLLGEK